MKICRRQRNVIELLEYAKVNNIKVITIEGNHDKAFFVDENSWLHFLHKKGYITLLNHKIMDGNLIIDSDSIYEDDDLRVIGIGYLGSTTSIYLKNIEDKIQKSNKFTVLMLHAAINRLCGEDMGDVNIETLQNLKTVVNYVALGHIHTRYEYNDLLKNAPLFRSFILSAQLSLGMERPSHLWVFTYKN